MTLFRGHLFLGPNELLQTLRLRFFGISRELRTSRSHVTRACRQVCGLRFTFVPLNHAPEVSDLPQGFCTSRHHNPTFEKKYDFLELFCLLIIQFYFKKRNFEDKFSAKIEASGWMTANMAAASYHPRILSVKYGQTANVKSLTANGSLSFAVKWPTSIRGLYLLLSLTSIKRSLCKDVP